MLNLKPSLGLIAVDSLLFKIVTSISLIKEEMGDILFVLTCLSNQMNIDLEECFDISMRKKTQRDSVRHLNNKKLS